MTDVSLVLQRNFADLQRSDPEEYRALEALAKRAQKHQALLAKLDVEQATACLASGPTVVSAGAGSGKTFTLQTRLRLLLAEGVDPSRITVVTFNRAAAQEVKDRVADVQGAERLNIGTMHSIFGRLVAKYGNKIQKDAITSLLVTDEKRSQKAPSLRQFSGLLYRTWRECKGEDPPRQLGTILQKWAVLGINPANARHNALTTVELAAADWFEWWQGFRGVLGSNWEPPCEGEEGRKRWQTFLARFRPNRESVLGELNDMVLLLDEILSSSRDAARAIAADIEHLLVDEGQDLNPPQHRIIGELRRAGVNEVWIVGDERQSINSFVGASPELFSSLPDQGYLLHQIQTNYRSLPEIVILANALMSVHDTRLNIDSRPDPKKDFGRADIRVVDGLTHEELASRIVARVRRLLSEGGDPASFAVLSRTNRELDAFETACLRASVPYTRRGSNSFLRSPEVVAVRSYLETIVNGQLDAVAKILDKPARFFLRQDEAPQVVSAAIETIAARTGKELLEVAIEDLFGDVGVQSLAQALQNLSHWQVWQTRPAIEELERLGRSVLGIRSSLEDYSTRKLIEEVLKLDGAPPRAGRKRPTLAETLLPFGGDAELDSSVPEPSEAQPLGSLEYLFSMVEENPDLAKPSALLAHLSELEAVGNEIAYSSTEWGEEQSNLPLSERRPIPALTLSTVHSVKGLQWESVFVVLGPGIFPWKQANDKPLSEEAERKLAARRKEDQRTERQLAYVAWTRARNNLWLLAPSRSAYGLPGERCEYLSESAVLELTSQNVSASTLPTLREVVELTPDYRPRRELLSPPTELAQESLALLRSFGINITKRLTTPKDGKKPIDVWIVDGRTSEQVDVLKSAGGRLFDRSWSFYEDPTERLASLLRQKVTPTDQALESAGDEQTGTHEDSTAADTADLSDAKILSLNRLQVVETLTTPKRAGKQPRPVWNVEGLTSRFEEILREAGGKRFAGRWSFWKDPTKEIAAELRKGAPSMGDVLAYRQQRSAARAERLTAYADKQATEASRRFGAARAIGEVIPFGQPIHVGHHSEGRHRADLRRIDNNMRKGVEASRASEELRRKAEAAASNAGNPSEFSQKYLMNRINEREARLRSIARDVAKYGERDVWKADQKRVQEELEHFRKILEEQGGLRYSKDKIKIGDEVLYYGKWYPVTRLNPKSVSVSTPQGADRVYGGILYERIKGLRPAQTEQTRTEPAKTEPKAEAAQTESPKLTGREQVKKQLSVIQAIAEEIVHHSERKDLAWRIFEHLGGQFAVPVDREAITPERIEDALDQLGMQRAETAQDNEDNEDRESKATPKGDDQDILERARKPWRELLQVVESGTPILLSDPVYGLPTIHDVPRTSFAGMGVLTALLPSGEKITFDGGSAMRRTEGIAWTDIQRLPDPSKLVLKDGQSYSMQNVKNQLKKLLAHPNNPAKADEETRPVEVSQSDAESWAEKQKLVDLVKATPPHPAGIWLALEAQPNEDFGRDTPKGSVSVPVEWRQVSSLGEAVEQVRGFIKKHQLGSGNFVGLAGKITRNGQPWAQISYNLRVWEGWQWNPSQELDLQGEPIGSAEPEPDRASDSVCDASKQDCELGILGGQCGIRSVLLVRDGDSSTSLAARYCLTDVTSLIPSHVSPAAAQRLGRPAFSKRDDYPPNVQERRYDQATELVKVQRIAADLVPEEVVSLVSNPLTGPPIVTRQGWVLGGNGRTMALDLFWLENPGRNRLREFLVSAAGQFGFTEQQLAKFERPVIVRVVDTLAGRNGRSPSSVTEKERAELVWLVRVTNFSTAQGLDQISASVSASRALPSESLDFLASGLGEDSLNEYLDSAASTAFVGSLVRASVIPANDPNLFSGPNRLSVSGRELVERLLAARLIPEPDLLEKGGAELRRSLAQMAPYLLAAKQAAPGFDLADLVALVVRDWLNFRASGVDMASYLRSPPLLASERIERTDPRHLTLLEYLTENLGRYRVLSKAARSYLAAAAEFVSPQQGLFGEAKESEPKAFRRIFGGKT